jgi:cytochrome c-type biogenesis protein CcmH/NrfF
MKRATRSTLGATALLLALGWATLTQAEHDTNVPANLAAKLLGVDPDRDQRKLTDPAQIDYAKAVGQEAVCLCGTCPRHTITNCDCGWAHFNRRTIQLALLDGKTKADILKAYETAYGLKVFPTPPDDGLGRMSYLLPYAAAGLGLLAVLLLGLRMRGGRRGATAPAASRGAPQGAEEDEARKALARELDELD